MAQFKRLTTEEFMARAVPFFKKWGFSLLGFPFVWILIRQFWKALDWDISFAYLYDYPALLKPLYLMTDAFLLIIHEAGHTFFGLLGWRFLGILGGTLLEILLPFSIFVIGWINRKAFTAQLGLLLTGFAWLDSAAYAADALARRLPLIGGLGKSAHDFGNMLQQLDMMAYHQEIGWMFYGTGILFLGLFLAWPKLGPQPERYVKLDLDL